MYPRTGIITSDAIIKFSKSLTSVPMFAWKQKAFISNQKKKNQTKHKHLLKGNLSLPIASKLHLAYIKSHWCYFSSPSYTLHKLYSQTMYSSSWPLSSPRGQRSWLSSLPVSEIYLNTNISCKLKHFHLTQMNSITLKVILTTAFLTFHVTCLLPHCLLMTYTNHNWTLGD